MELHAQDIVPRHGGDQSSAVVGAPVRDAVYAGSDSEANRVNRERAGAGVSRQASDLRPRITEVDGWLRQDLPHRVVEVVPDEKIVLKWDAAEGEAPNLPDNPPRSDMATAPYKTTVTMTFTPLDGDTRTLVEIREEGWRETQGALEASYGNCQGWSQMLDALKAWVEHGINLREGLYN